MTTHPVRVINPRTNEPETIKIAASSPEHARRSAIKQGLELADAPNKPAPRPEPRPAPRSAPVQTVRLDDASIRKLARKIGWQVFFAILIISIIAPIIIIFVWGMIVAGLNTPLDGSF